MSERLLVTPLIMIAVIQCLLLLAILTNVLFINDVYKEVIYTKGLLEQISKDIKCTK